VTGPAAGTTVMCNHDGALIVFAGGGWPCESKSQVSEKLAEVLDMLPSFASHHYFGFHRGQCSCTLNPSLRKDDRATQSDHNPGDRTRLANGKETSVRSVKGTDRFQQRKIVGEQIIDVGVRSPR
jgi:hypothetical protein